MSSIEEKFSLGSKNAPTQGKTIDLQGVAAFASLVEMLAQELGSSAGRIQGLLPNGPASFEELMGEIPVDSQGFQRLVTLFAKPGSPLRMRFNCSWRDTAAYDREGALVSGVEALIILEAPVEQVLPQGRALARHIEDMLALMDRMVTLGQSHRLSSMSISDLEINKFETSEAGNLVRSASEREELL